MLLAVAFVEITGYYTFIKKIKYSNNSINKLKALKGTSILLIIFQRLGGWCELRIMRY